MPEPRPFPRVAVLGAGAFGRALAHVAAMSGPVALLGRRPADGVSTDVAAGLRGADLVILAVPAQATRAVLAAYARAIPEGAPLILAAKGLETDGGALQSEIAAEIGPPRPFMALTGPSFAADIAADLPTAVTLAATDADAGRAAQARLAGAAFRPYLSDDVIGAEIGGALKNVIAIACGAAIGRGLGDSARAALMTRGFAEMTRIATAKGGRAETLAGLSGLGDLALTAASLKSRNFAFGFALGRGEPPAAGVTQEGVATAAASAALAARLGVEAPIIAAVARLAAGESDVDEEMAALLSRPLRRET
ncbi:NAD(P)H-dependent glycerol-3-phosphate dehydrogenase [Pikeienuella sp. HZG-20]|uniref:NAD(P)H-dependent glycerol-3-phosphate dehydrogenase n=1 Tax=Paludibacillus litoralis TaxID=3133267 RepID=UPI0030EDACB3